MLSIFQERVPLFDVTVTEFAIGVVAVVAALWVIRFAITTFRR